jgi:hypothetical protein
MSTFFSIVEDEVDDQFCRIVEIASAYDERTEGLGDYMPAVKRTDIDVLYFKSRHILEWVE